MAENQHDQHGISTGVIHYRQRGAEKLNPLGQASGAGDRLPGHFAYALAGMLLGSRFIAQSKHSGCPAGEFEDLTIDAQ